jgi:hypothetical protein
MGWANFSDAALRHLVGQDDDGVSDTERRWAVAS